MPSSPPTQIVIDLDHDQSATLRFLCDECAVELSKAEDMDLTGEHVQRLVNAWFIGAAKQIIGGDADDLCCLLRNSYRLIHGRDEVSAELAVIARAQSF